MITAIFVSEEIPQACCVINTVHKWIYGTSIIIYQLYRKVCDEKHSNFKWVTFSTWPEIPFCHDTDSWHWQSLITFQPVCTVICYTPEVIVKYAHDFLIVHFQHLWYPWKQHKQNWNGVLLWRNRFHYGVLYFNDTSFTLHKIKPKRNVQPSLSWLTKN